MPSSFLSYPLSVGIADYITQEQVVFLLIYKREKKNISPGIRNDYGELKDPQLALKEEEDV